MIAELLAPAGDFETALAAFAAGADAVYCGLADFSARAFAKNFTCEDLKRLLAFARQEGAPRRRVYVTFNTLVDEDRLDEAVETLAQLDEVGPDGVIVQDLGVARLCRAHFPRLELHASTQLVAHNLEGVLELKELGFRRVVLARELSLAEVASIAKRCGAVRMADDGRPELELECFVHGALCYSLSGLCLFGAMEKGRSGNRGTCPYCCRQGFRDADAQAAMRYPFSMKDLRLGEDARQLVEAGVSSLKIEGRMKAPLYVASVTRYYRQILDAGAAASPRRGQVTPADLETVFSRRTTELYFNGRPGAVPADSPVDPESLGHLGTVIGTVKRVTKDRDGLSWLRFHTARGLEKHDGLQFEATDDGGRHLGLGIVEMRQAISRRPVFEVNAGVDVEILLPEKDGEPSPWSALRSGMKVYCSMSNAVKRMFPAPSYRPSDYAGTCAVDLSVSLSSREVRVTATSADGVFAPVSLADSGDYPSAENPAKTFGAVEKAFSRLGGTDYRIGRLTLDDPDRVYVPMRVLNDLRRDLVAKLEDARFAARQAKLDAVADARAELTSADAAVAVPLRSLKLRLGQKLPSGDWDEIVVAVDPTAADMEVALAGLKAAVGAAAPIRVALPVYTPEPDFNRLRTTVKRLLRAGWTRWECADLATLRLLRALDVKDLTADWSLYAFNGEALALLAARGVTRFVASPENGRENLQYLAESGRPVAFLEQQSTPLFISLTRPETGGNDPEGLRVFRRDGLWVTTRPAPRTFAVPEGAPRRLDLSWDPT